MSNRPAISLLAWVLCAAACGSVQGLVGKKSGPQSPSISLSDSIDATGNSKDSASQKQSQCPIDNDSKTESDDDSKAGDTKDKSEKDDDSKVEGVKDKNSKDDDSVEDKDDDKQDQKGCDDDKDDKDD